MNIIIKQNYDEMSEACAVHISEYIKKNPNRLLCFAAGDTPLGILKKLIIFQEAGKINLDSMYYVGLDEWVGLGYQDKGSCRQIMQDNFYGPAKISPERIRIFDGLLNPDDETSDILEYIDNKNGIGMVILGIGMNGHIGFNEPGTPEDFSGGKLILSETSLTVGQKYFDKKHDLKYGVTLGIKTLANAENIVLTANGEKKADIISKSLKEIDNPLFPASYLTSHPNFYVFLDNASYKIKK